MNVEITRYALDRVPLSIIFDDSTLLINLNYFWMRDRNLVDGENRRWQDIPVVHPESFTRQFAEWCLEKGVRGKFSIVPFPAGIGRVDQRLPLFSQAQQESWLRMCHQLIVPAFDITPEMITHTCVVDPETLKPVEPQVWEQYEWSTLPEDQSELIVSYIKTACQMLLNLDFSVEGVTSPGGFGGRTLPLYARAVGEAIREITGNPTPYFFKRVSMDDQVEIPVWYADKASGQAVGEIIASTGDWTGSWTGYGEVDADKYITADLQGGRLPQLIRQCQPVVLISHWQGFYGLHQEDQRGFKAFQTVVNRLSELDPDNEYTRWQKCSEITNYACAREMTEIKVGQNLIELDLPLRVPEFTLSLSKVDVSGVTVAGVELRPVSTRKSFQDGTFLRTRENTLIAFTPKQRQIKVQIYVASA